MTEQIATLIAKRGTYKAQLTRFCTFVDTFTTNSSVTELKKRLEKIEKTVYPEFDNIQIQIELLDNKDEQLNERSTFENTYYQYISQAEEIIQGKLENANLTTSITTNVTENISSQLSGVKLPTIKLPTFQGSLENWLEFYDIFDSLIIKNTQINDIQKFHYLKSCVTGEASRVISSLETSAANFNIAWNLLYDSYNNKRLLINNHIKALFHLPSINKESSVQLRNLIDNLNKNLRSLEALEQSTKDWDPLLIYMVTEKLDPATTREWEEEAHKSKDPLNVNKFLTFLKNKADLLETIHYNKPNSVISHKNNMVNAGDNRKKTFFASKYSCSLCKGSHKLFKCPDFEKLSIKSRIEHVQKANLCVNCLNFGHSVENCKFGACKKCSLNHNSLLHSNSNISTQGQETESHSNSSENRSTTLASYSSVTNHTLLSTAIVQVCDKRGKTYKCRVLLDNASESSFITEALCNRLGLEMTDFSISVLGIGQVSSSINHKCEVHIQALHSGYSFNLSCLVIPEICNHMPTQFIDTSSLNIPSNIHLADPQFFVPSSIDMLIGADLFWSLICVGQIRLGKGYPILQKTKLGWIISGPLSKSLSGSQTSHCNFIRHSNIQSQLEKFWEIQEMHFPSKPLSKEEIDFESHFVSTFRRNNDGKFLVSIPFKDSLDTLGDSEEYARKRFFNLERKLQANPEMHKKYVEFINEYIEMNHMSKVVGSPPQIVNFFPHHGVLKEDSLTTKLRVVFDGSCPSSSGVSLNQIQMAGAILQDDLFSIILRFRQFSYVVSADVEKMYRCVWIAPEQRSLQQIFWRENPSQPLQVFQLNTVTYGTTSASFLAIRCLHQLSIESSHMFPLASKAIAHSFYVDDFLHGADSKEELATICMDVSNILQQAGFHLRKWISNEPQIIKNINCSNNHIELLKLGITENFKTLGVFWSSITDNLCFKITPLDLGKSKTKRSILSNISQIYDPLGLLSACIISVKILLQKLWSANLGWDETVPTEIYSKWSKFVQELINLNSLKIQRHIRFRNSVRTELHCFCDSSENAYATCMYIRSVNEQGKVMSHLLCAKSKVAPLKVLTIPRLELQGALILSRLAEKVCNSLYIKFDEIFYWSDSTIVLSWLRTSPNLLKTFVANRVCEIQSKTDITKWRHINSGDNPADLASRGVSPMLLLTSEIWWHGPQWLLSDSNNWPGQNITFSGEIPEMKNSVSMLLSKKEDFKFPFERFSNYLRLVRSVAYCIRFSYNCQRKILRVSDPLTADELNKATLAIIKLIQREHFNSEYTALSQSKPLHSKSPLLSLTPFLSQGILRVGGRLRNSKFHYDKQHPILLPKNHVFVKLLFRYEHIRLGHSGPNQLLSSIRNKFWPISGINVAKQTVHSCVRCFRAKPVSMSPLMGDLPSSRVTPSPPFFTTGVDYAGPFTLKDKKGRGCKYIKGYVSLFICFSTKAIHLELVTELSTECLIAALRRFVSRRGKPSHMISDNGTNFVGAKNEFHNLGQFLQNSKDKFIDATALEGINWSFIPPYSPHFGGLWESGVKLMKFHLKRIMGNVNFTYEDFSTILIQVEGVLNSRPLCPLSSNPNDLVPLTPSHFLIGRPITSIPDPDVREIKQNRLSKFQLMQQLIQHFWARWSSDYINELQCRKKWKINQKHLQAGALVLIKDNNQPPLCWALGRVQELHPGKDNVPRVASIRTCKGVVRRAINNLCPLPLEEISTSQSVHDSKVLVS